jgi:hypothetical protein
MVFSNHSQPAFDLRFDVKQRRKAGAESKAASYRSLSGANTALAIFIASAKA